MLRADRTRGSLRVAKSSCDAAGAIIFRDLIGEPAVLNIEYDRAPSRPIYSCSDLLT